MKLNMTFEEWDKIIRQGVGAFDIILTEQQIRLFYQHAEELMHWTRKVNLTAIKDPREIAIKHFVDSLGPSNFLIPMKTVLDVGSGGGFPGLPLKVLHPYIDLTLVDAVRKKTSFIQHVIRRLKLKGAKAIHTRVEDLRQQKAFIPFDTIICRAFSDLAFIIFNALPLLSPGGKIVVWKGRMPENEIKELQTCFPVETLSLEMTIEPYRLPVYDAERTIVKITKTGNASGK